MVQPIHPLQAERHNMTPVRGWKARRDAAAKNAKNEKSRTEIRRERAKIIEQLQPETDASEFFQTTEMLESRRSDTEDWSGENSKEKTPNFPEEDKTFNKTAETVRTADLTDDDAEDDGEDRSGDNSNKKSKNVPEEEKTLNATAERGVTEADISKALKDNKEDLSGENSKDKSPNVAEDKKTFNKTAEESDAKSAPEPKTPTKGKAKKETEPKLVDGQYLVEED